MCEMMDVNTDINIKVDLKGNKKKNSRECSEELDNQRRKLMRREGFISQDQYFDEQIKKVHEEHSKGKEYELLESYSPILSKGCEETNNASTDKFGNNIPINSHNNEEDVKPIHSRFRKQDKHNKKKRRNKSGKTTVNNDHVQDGVIQCSDSNQMKSCNETITTIGLDEKDIKSEVVNQVKNPNPCDCQSLIDDLPCNCINLKNQGVISVDYEKIIKENIPDNKIPIKPKKTIMEIMEKVTDFIKNFKNFKTMIYGYESDEQFDEESRNSSNFWRKIPSPDIRKLDPLAPNSISLWPSNPTATISHNYESNGDSSRISNNTNYMNNNYQDNNQCNSLSTESSTQYTYPHFLLKSIHLLVLIITFEFHQLGRPNPDKCHLKGYHPIVRNFGNPEIDGNKAVQFVHDSIMNCWANSWKVALVVSTDPMRNARELYYFLEEIRKGFESEILDIIFVQPSNPTGYLNYLNVHVATNSDETWEQKFDNIMDKIIKKAYRRNKYGRDEILFYNKDEPYYEFTNFYRAKIVIDYEEWPTTEHYFQAAKFHDKYLRNKIRNVYSAREAFIIARKNDFQKRKDWESPKPPDNEIFKETVMRSALFQKFTQHKYLKYKLLSTGKVKIFEHTVNDRYWGDGGGRNHDGFNRLGIMLQEIREIIMEGEKSNLINKYDSHSSIKWVVPGLDELRQFDDLIDFGK